MANERYYFSDVFRRPINSCPTGEGNCKWNEWVLKLVKTDTFDVIDNSTWSSEEDFC